MKIRNESRDGANQRGDDSNRYEVSASCHLF